MEVSAIGMGEMGKFVVPASAINQASRESVPSHNTRDVSLEATAGQAMPGGAGDIGRIATQSVAKGNNLGGSFEAVM